MSARAVVAGLLALAYSAAAAALDVSGPITSVTTWSSTQSPYRVTADVTITGGAVLTIEPGVIVYLDPGTNLTVGAGALRALGTAAQPVVFTAAADNGVDTPAPGGWGALHFLDGTNDSLTILENVHVRYGRGIVVESASPTFNYVTLSNNSGPAISIDLSSSPVGIGVQATGNAVNGVLVPAGEITGAVLWGLRGIPYVASGGLISVGRAPAVSSLTPNEIEQGTTVDIVISGTRLTGVEKLTFGNPDVTGTILAGATPTFIPVRVTATENASLGPFPVELQVEAGSVSIEGGLTVIPPRPPVPLSVYVVPNPLATPPDGSRREFYLRLSAPQPVDRSFSVAVRNTSIATVSPAVVNFAPGQTAAAVNLVGLQAGQTVLDVESAALPGPVEFPVYVSADFAKINFAHGAIVGIVRGDPTSPDRPAPGNPVASVPVGLVRGDSTLPLAPSAGSPVTSVIVGIVKGDSTLPLATTGGGVAASPVVGVVKGDSTLPLVSTPAGPVTSAVVGVEKQEN